METATMALTATMMGKVTTRQAGMLALQEGLTLLARKQTRKQRARYEYMPSWDGLPRKCLCVCVSVCVLVEGHRPCMGEPRAGTQGSREGRSSRTAQGEDEEEGQAEARSAREEGEAIISLSS